MTYSRTSVTKSKQKYLNLQENTLFSETFCRLSVHLFQCSLQAEIELRNWYPSWPHKIKKWRKFVGKDHCRTFRFWI